MKNFRRIVINSVFCLIALNSIQATMVEFTQDVSAMQAPQEIIIVAQKAAELVNFVADYEIAVPTVMGIEMNPLNKFTWVTTNQLTKRPLIIVNPDWFGKMPKEQQIFLLARNFLVFKEGKTLLMQVLPYLYILLSLLLVFLFFWLLGKTPLKNQKTWVRVLLALLLAGACEPLFLDKLYADLLRHLGRRYDVHILKSVVEKTKDKDAAIKALELFDDSINAELKIEEKFWTPYKGLFGLYAQELKRNS